MILCAWDRGIEKKVSVPSGGITLPFTSEMRTDMNYSSLCSYENVQANRLTQVYSHSTSCVPKKCVEKASAKRIWKMYIPVDLTLCVTSDSSQSQWTNVSIKHRRLVYYTSLQLRHEVRNWSISLDFIHTKLHRFW